MSALDFTAKGEFCHRHFSWLCQAGQGQCATEAAAANLPDQPDGIEGDSRDLPDPVVAAERVREYIRANGDGLYDVQDGAPLYARDLEAVARAVLGGAR